MSERTQITVNEIDANSTPIKVSRGIGTRIMDLVKVDTHEAGVLHVGEAQQAQDIARGADLGPIEITPDMEQRIESIHHTPERHL